MMKHASVLLLGFFLLIHPSCISAADKQIVLVTYKSQDSPDGIFLNLVYTEAFKRLGMTFVYGVYPAKRCSHMSDAGTVDGELSRIYSYNDAHPNVIRVEEPHWLSGFIAVAKDLSIRLDGWNSLKDTAYMVNYKRGIKGCEINLSKVVRPEQLEVVNEVEQGFKKLLAGWADLYIGAEMNMLGVLESEAFRNSGVQVVGVMETFTAHVFLHKKHATLVPKLSEVLKEMKQERLVDEYRNTAKLLTYFNE